VIEQGECESALKLHQPRKGRHRKCQGQNRDLGNPTVRDRRGASGNVTMGAGLRPRTKVLELPPDPNVRAPEIYPDLLFAQELEKASELHITQLRSNRGNVF